MNLLHSITSSHTTAHRSGTACWPTGTQHTCDDVLIGVTSLASTARNGHTPFVRIGEAPAANDASPRLQDVVTVVVTRVAHVDHLGVLQRPDVWIDAALRGCEPILGAARVIGRPTTDRRQKVRILTEGDLSSHRVMKVPVDIRTGDLLAIPCVGTIPRNQVTGHDIIRPSVPSHGKGDPEEADGFSGFCGK